MFLVQILRSPLRVGRCVGEAAHGLADLLRLRLRPCMVEVLRGLQRWEGQAALLFFLPTPERTSLQTSPLQTLTIPALTILLWWLEKHHILSSRMLKLALWLLLCLVVCTLALRVLAMAKLNTQARRFACTRNCASTSPQNM